MPDDILTSAQQVERFERNERRVNTWVNTMDSYSTEAVPPRNVPSIPQLMAYLQTLMQVVVYRGAWGSGEAYQINNVVDVDGTKYICAAGHTSGSDFAADLAAGRWIVYGSQVILPGSETAAGIGFTASGDEAQNGQTDPSRGEYPAWLTPESLAQYAAGHWPQAATQNAPGLVVLATPDDIDEEDPTQTDNSKAATPKLLQFVGDGLYDELSPQATETQLGRVYLPTATELESGEPDAGREGLSIVLPLGEGGSKIDPEGELVWIIETSGDFVIPEDGVYEILAVGGGGGSGGARGGLANVGYSGGGNSGSWSRKIAFLAKGTVLSVTIGAGGAGGSANAGTGGGSGGTTKIAGPNVTLEAVGGGGGGFVQDGTGSNASTTAFGVTRAIGSARGDSVFVPQGLLYGAGANGVTARPNGSTTGYVNGLAGNAGCVQITRLS